MNSNLYLVNIFIFPSCYSVQFLASTSVYVLVYESPSCTDGSRRTVLVIVAFSTGRRVRRAIIITLRVTRVFSSPQQMVQTRPRLCSWITPLRRYFTHTGSLKSTWRLINHARNTPSTSIVFFQKAERHRMEIYGQATYRRLRERANMWIISIMPIWRFLCCCYLLYPMAAGSRSGWYEGWRYSYYDPLVIWNTKSNLFTIVLLPNYRTVLPEFFFTPKPIKIINFHKDLAAVMKNLCWYYTAGKSVWGLYEV